MSTPGNFLIGKIAVSAAGNVPTGTLVLVDETTANIDFGVHELPVDSNDAALITFNGERWVVA